MRLSSDVAAGLWVHFLWSAGDCTEGTQSPTPSPAVCHNHPRVQMAAHNWHNCNANADFPSRHRSRRCGDEPWSATAAGVDLKLWRPQAGPPPRIWGGASSGPEPQPQGSRPGDPSVVPGIRESLYTRRMEASSGFSGQRLIKTKLTFKQRCPIFTKWHCFKCLLLQGFPSEAFPKRTLVYFLIKLCSNNSLCPLTSAKWISIHLLK